MAGIFNLLFNGANIGVFQADFSSFFANCVLVASIWIIVASYEVRGLDTTLSNFAVSDKPVFHGFENRHFEKIKHRLRGGFICVGANSKVCFMQHDFVFAA